jgi:hypothetical protein
MDEPTAPASVDSGPRAETPPTGTPLSQETNLAGAKGPAQVVNIGESKAETANFINEQNIHNHLRVVSKYFESDAISVERPFSRDDATPFTQKLAAELTETFVGDDATTRRLLRHLEEHRILLITGQRDIGKRTAALYVSVRIAEQRRIHEPPLLVDTLERHVGIDLRDVAADKETFGKRAIVFADAFEQQNRQLRAFFGTTDHVGWNQLTELLKTSDSYFIFTSTSGSVPFREQATDRIAHCELQPLKPELVEQGIDRWLLRMKAAESSDRGRVELLETHRATLVAELKTLSRAVSFLRHFVRDESDLEGALRRFRDASYWFRTALAADVDAWMFALALTLSQPSPHAESTPWADFERLRRALADGLRADKELFPRRRQGDTEDESACPDTVVSFADDVLLERCRAVIVKDANRLGDVVRFEDSSVVAQLWETILTRYRRILMVALPALRSLAEDDRSDWSLRVLAAQVIGRIGEIDPGRMALPIIHQWAISGDQALRPLVGRVVQGALASHKETYRNLALRSIEWLTDVQAMGNDEEAKDGLLTAIGAYAQIGQYESTRAMERLGAIVIEHLAPIFEKFHESARAAETVDTKLSKVALHRGGELLRRRFQFSRAATQLFREHAPALIAVGQTVSHLCLAHDPIQILRQMRDWTAKGGASTGVLVSFLFLRGVAADLHEVHAAGGVTTSRLLQSLAISRDAVLHFCSFLADVHASINSTFVLPAWLQQDFHERLGECFTAWARDAIANGDYRRNVQDVFAGVATARGGGARRDVLAILETPAFAATESMRSFAAEVRRRLTGER